MYKPLPSNVTIKESKIHGFGLFAKEFIHKETELGITHHFLEEQIIRTPLGGFYNHSEDPNCYSVIGAGMATLVSLRGIEEGEELTVFYTINPLPHP
tara:strand:- start:36 stop:326 length:291 start_codon:yes stop_codon:yes gene_type:complete